MKNILLFAMLIVFGNILYAQDVVLETINETEFGTQNGQVTVEVQNVGAGVKQNAFYNPIDSTELLIALLSKDSLVYRPEGDPFIISLIKQNDLRSMEFLLLHCHERPLITGEGGFAFEDMQHYFARRVYIEDLIVRQGDKWIFVSAFSSVIKEREFSDDRLSGLCSILRRFFTRPTYTGILLEMERFASPLVLKNISIIKTKLNL